MSYQQLSFAPDRRSVQTTFYHFSERSSGSFDKHGFSQQDSLIWALDKIYQSKFTNISQQFRSVLVNILVTQVPLLHQNLTMLAAANLIVYDMRTKQIQIDITQSNFTTGQTASPRNLQIFEAYFNYVAPFIMPDLNGKNPEEILLIRANFKVTLLRYIIYVQEHTVNFLIRTNQT